MRVPSHSTVVAYLALFVALGGTTYAATRIGSKEIKDNSIQSRDIKNRAIALTDISTKARASLRGQRGAQGVAGAPGAPGSQGPAGPSGVPADAAVVSATGTAIENGAQLRAALAALPTATAADPQAIVLGVGHFDAAAGTSGFTIPAYVTLVGQGPRTVVENRTVNNFQPVLALGTGAVVRDLSVVNTSTNIGARGIDGQTAKGTLVEGVAVEARTGILLRSATLRDASIIATSEGLRIAAPVTDDDAEIDNVTVRTEGTGVGDRRRDRRRRRRSTASTRTPPATPRGPGCASPAAAVWVRDSRFRAIGVTAVGVDVAPLDPSATSVHFDHSTALTFGTTAYGLRTVGGTSRIGSSTVDGTTADVSESDPGQARCVYTHDAAYVSEVSC